MKLAILINLTTKNSNFICDLISTTTKKVIDYIKIFTFLEMNKRERYSKIHEIRTQIATHKFTIKKY